jgi:hypothetical protein
MMDFSNGIKTFKIYFYNDMIKCHDTIIIHATSVEYAKDSFRRECSQWRFERIVELCSECNKER